MLDDRALLLLSYSYFQSRFFRHTQTIVHARQQLAFHGFLLVKSLGFTIGVNHGLLSNWNFVIFVFDFHVGR